MTDDVEPYGPDDEPLQWARDNRAAVDSMTTGNDDVNAAARALLRVERESRPDPDDLQQLGVSPENVPDDYSQYDLGPVILSDKDLDRLAKTVSP